MEQRFKTPKIFENIGETKPRKDSLRILQEFGWMESLTGVNHLIIWYNKNMEDGTAVLKTSKIFEILGK